MTCPGCGATDQAGAFCSQCGAEVGGSGARPSRPPWWIAVAAAVVVVLILLIPERADRAGPLPAVQPEAGPGAPGTGMGFTGDMRTDADRLFNRVMGAAEAGRQPEVDQFMPMALQAYEMVPALDDDGLFHLAILYETAGDYGMARSTAERILRDSPDHILALGVAGTSSAAAGDQDAATGYFQRLVSGYDRESERMLPEYLDHAAMVEEYRRIAESFLRQR